MSRMLIFGLLFGLFSFIAPADAQFTSARLYCYVVGPPSNWLPCTVTNPVPTTGGGGLTGNLGNNVDNVPPVATGNVGADSYEYVFDGTNWQRAQPVNAGTAGVPGTDVLSVQPPLGTPVAMQTAAVANGNGVVLPITTFPLAIINSVCSVACSGGTTQNFEGTDSTGTFFPILGTPLAGGAGVTTATAGGQWAFNTAGLVSIRVRISGYSAGTITVTGNQAFGSAATGSGGGGGGAVTQSGVWTVQPGNTANTTAWLMNLGSMGGTAISASCVSNYGTSPGAVACPSVNTFVTNSVPSVTVGGTQLSPVGIFDSTGVQVNSYPAGTFTTPSASTISTVTLDPCTSAAKSSAVINITTATTTSLVAISGTTSIYVCGVSMTVSEVITTPNTILFEYGTGATCGTGTTPLTGKYGDGGVTAGIPIVVNAGNGGTVFSAPAGSRLCALTAIGATASFQGVLTYVQQ